MLKFFDNPNALDINILYCYYLAKFEGSSEMVLRAEFYFLTDFPTTILYDHANNYGYITKSISQILTIYSFNNSALLYRLLF